MKNAMTKEQLNNLDKDTLIEMVLSLSSQMEKLSSRIDTLIEQLASANNERFGKKSEAGLVDENQLRIFNETEYYSDPNIKESPDEIVIPAYTRKKHKGKRDEDLSGFEAEIIEHEIPEEKLDAVFPDGYSRLPDEVYRKLEYLPAQHKVYEHHIFVYKGKKDGKIIKADHPVEMLNKSIATPSLAAAIINGKYTNSLPLYRMEQEFERNDIHISRQVMANWMITLGERYISLLYDRMKKEIVKTHVVHADETPFYVNKDGREEMHKNYMWVYRTGTMCKANNAIVYEYQPTRKQSYPLEFLNGFNGTLVCDGYQVYHNLEKNNDDISVAGCWAHARRYFAKKVKNGKGSLGWPGSNEALAMIAEIYHIDGALLKLPPSERKKRRQLLVKPLVDEYFAWVKSMYKEAMPDSSFAEALSYSINQEEYLRKFLDDPKIPMDNNIAERSIRSFCIGKHNWKIIDTIRGAQTSAMYYSIVETAKENNIRIYEYFKYLLTEIPKHMDETSLDFIEEMLPWSKKLPKECYKKE